MFPILKKQNNFESGIFWKLYLDLERQFQDFLEYVPYLPGNENVYSFKLLNLILSIGGHVDSAFKEMARYSEFSDNTECKEIVEIIRDSEEKKLQGKAPRSVPISLCLEAFDKLYRLSKERVILKLTPNFDLLRPFNPFNTKTKAPEWWEIYNGLKHDVGLNMEKANLENTTLALAGAFLLNVRHIPSALRLYDLGLLKTGDEKGEKIHGVPACEVLLRDQIKELLKSEIPCFTESPIFLYNYWKDADPVS